MGEKITVSRGVYLLVVSQARLFACCVLSFFAVVLVTALVFQSACPRVCKRFHNPAAVSASWNEFLYKSEGNGTNFGVILSLFRASGKAVAWYMGQPNGEVLAVHQKVSRTICKNLSNGFGEHLLSGSDTTTPVVKTFLLKASPNSMQEAEHREFKTSSDGLFLNGNVQKQPLHREKDIDIQALPRGIHHDQLPIEETGYTEHQLEEGFHIQALPRGIHRGQSDNSPSMRKRHKEHLSAKTWNNQESQNVRLRNWLTQATVQNLEIENEDDETLHTEMITNDVGQFNDETTDISSVFNQNNLLEIEQNPLKSVRNFDVSGGQQMRTTLEERVLGLETLHKQDVSDSASTGSAGEFHQHQHHESRNKPYGTDVADFVSASSENATEITSSPTSTSPKEKVVFLYVCAVLIVVVLVIGPMLLVLIAWLVHRRKNRRPVERLPLLAHQNVN